MGWGGVGVAVYLSLTGWEVDWSWALIRGWALIGGLALIPINMVRVFLVQFSPVTSESNPFTSQNLSYGTNSPKRPEIFDVTIIFLKLYLCKNCNLCATYQLSPSIKYSSEFNSKFSFINFNFQKFRSYLYSRLRDGNGCAAQTMEPECLMPSK